MAENVDYDSNATEYNYSSTDSQYLETIEFERFGENKYENSDDLYAWRSFVSDLKNRRIKIKRNRGWFYDSNKKDDINYTFDLYKKKFEKNSSSNTDREDYFLSTMASKYKNIFVGIYNNYFYYEKSFFLFSWKNEVAETGKLKNISKLTSEEFDDFITAIKEREIKVLNKPKSWFLGEEPSLEDNLEYTLKKYSQVLSQLKTNPLYYENIDKMKTGKQNLDKRFKSPRKIFIEKNPGLIDLYKNFVMENDEQFDNLLNHLFVEKNLPENAAKNLLINEAMRKYNFENDKNNENIKNFTSLSIGMKEKTREEGKRLVKFYQKIAPFFEDYEARNKAPDKSFKEQILKVERNKWDIVEEKSEVSSGRKKLKLPIKKSLETKKYEQEIEDLEYKISDAQSKYSMSKAKLRRLDGKLKNLRDLEKKRDSLQQKLREKNLTIEKKQQLLKEKTELNEKLKNIEKLESQVADLKSRTPDLSIFEQEKIIREQELEKLKRLNDASIREKNALFRSIEFKKIKAEINLREEQRYQQEQRNKEELKQAKIVFLKEKKIAERKLDELKSVTKQKNDRIVELKKIEQDLLSQKKYFEKVKSEKESVFKEKKLKIEEQKIKTLQLQKQTLENKTYIAEQQKLFADSIQGDIDDLNAQKNILQDLRKENTKILQNTKDEIRKRQEEIEKTIKLNLESAKQREANILSEESKIKLDVFFTLEDVKDQTAKKLDLEKKLQDLKDEILRKQDVTDLLNETVEKIENNEISEAEEYNAFLESEIEFKKKLSSINLNQKQVLETLMEEKQSYLDLLKDTKSTFMQNLLNAKREIIEKNIKITLVEGKENLSYVTSEMKYDLEKLEKEKEILQRRTDLVKFQSDNFKRELNLRNQEIELLKNIRLKVLQKERLDARSEASKAIIDIVKKQEENQKQDVREKLDEIIDDVENREIDRKTKATIFSLIDKIEDSDNRDAAREKMDFILGKIELHDNIEESRKKLDEFFKDKQIKKEVSEKLDEILDDVELEDYDFLDEEDDFDNFLSSVKKHLSGEKKMEQFSKIDDILKDERKVDAKLKMSENIEMKRIGPEDYEQGEGSQETAFDDFDYTLFVNNIEDPVLREKTRENLKNIDSFDKQEDKVKFSKNAYKSAINKAWWEDKLDLDYWDGNIILDEQAKFLYEQKVNNINTALGDDYGVHIDPKDLRIREFLDIKLTETTSEKKGEINGYMYRGEKIISRNISRNFFFNYIKKPALCQSFIDELKGVINKTARSQIASESFFEGESVKHCAVEYIGELREEQSYQIDAAKNSKEMKDALREANDIGKEIQNIKKNLPFKMRLKIFKRTLSWRFTKLLRLLWKNKKVAGGILFTLIATSIGVLLNQLGVIEVVHNLKKAAASVKQYADDVHQMGRRIIENVTSLYRVPGQILGWALIFFAFFLKILYFFTRISGASGSSWVFGIFGTIIELTIYFSGNIETINEHAAEVIEETGNVIENAGIPSQKFIAKNMPRWYYDKPKEDRTILEHIEAGAANVIFKVAKGTQYSGKKVQQAGETIKTSLWYMQAFMVVSFSLLILLFIRNYIL